MKNYHQWLFRIITVCYCLFMFFGSSTYSFMALNVFLAYIPIEISFHLKKLRFSLFVGASFLWLLFYPNSPYLFTDFFHLEILPIYQGANNIFTLSVTAWFSFALLSFGILVYGILGMASVFTVIRQWQSQGLFCSNYQKILYFLFVNMLASLAIYVGRFDRLHSIDLFYHPIKTISTVLLQWSMEKVMFILIFTFFQLGIFYTLNIMQVLRSEKLY